MPSGKELPEQAVRPAYEKGPIDDSIYSNPVVIISRPAHGGHTIHFQLVSLHCFSDYATTDSMQIASLQGKTLDQLYNKPTEFHISPRSWFLPIASSPDHPHANSRTTKRRFPTLQIANGAALWCDSYVNIRNVCMIDWTLLEAYANAIFTTTQT